MVKVMPDYGTSLFSELVEFVLEERKKRFLFEARDLNFVKIIVAEE